MMCSFFQINFNCLSFHHFLSLFSLLTKLVINQLQSVNSIIFNVPFLPTASQHFQMLPLFPCSPAPPVFRCSPCGSVSDIFRFAIFISKCWQSYSQPTLSRFFLNVTEDSDYDCTDGTFFKHYVKKRVIFITIIIKNTKIIIRNIISTITWCCNTKTKT